MIKKTLFAMTATIALAACSSEENKLLQTEWGTPHNLPPFEQIEYRHYVPAFEAAIAESKQTVELITQCSDEPTFRNTIIPLDRANDHVNKVASIFFNIMETDVVDTMNVIAETVMPMLSVARDEVHFNDALFQRVKAVYDKRAESGLDSAQMRVVERYYKDFIRCGALLGKSDKERLMEINQRLSLLSHTFGNNMLAETNNSFKLVIDSVADLKGLPDNVISAAAEAASNLGMPGKWVFTLHNASIIPFLTYSERHDLRKQIYEAYTMRGRRGGENDNREVIREMVSLRIQKAKMLGYKTYAHYAIEENMAATPEAVDSFLAKVWAPALRKAKEELADLKKFAYRYNKTTTVEACDWWYWSQKLRAALYDVQETEISQYFELGKVRSGLFACANKLYGLKFTQLNDVPMYNKAENEAWQVDDADGSCLGVVYFDWHPRASKGGGAWCTTFQEPRDEFDGTHREAHVSIVCNFTRGAKGEPDLLTYDEMLTMFHEFGHALQSLFTKGYYSRTAGVVPGDYVEMPSQINEKWAASDEMLRSFALHHETGEVIPDALLEKIRRAALFNQGFASTEFLAAAQLDLAWHRLEDASNVPNVDEFEAKAMEEIGLIPEIAPRYRSTYFAHIFNGGYSAGYYVYEWAEMIVCDAFAAFVESGDIFNKELAAEFRKHCLAEMGDGDLMEQYVKFRGSKPEISHLMKSRGFAEERPKRAVKTDAKVGSKAVKTSTIDAEAKSAE